MKYCYHCGLQNDHEGPCPLVLPAIFDGDNGDGRIRIPVRVDESLSPGAWYLEARGTEPELRVAGPDISIHHVADADPFEPTSPRTTPRTPSKVTCDECGEAGGPCPVVPRPSVLAKDVPPTIFAGDNGDGRIRIPVRVDESLSPGAWYAGIAALGERYLRGARDRAGCAVYGVDFHAMGMRAARSSGRGPFRADESEDDAATPEPLDQVADEVESPAHYTTATGLFVRDTSPDGSRMYRAAEVADVLEAYGLESSGHLWNVGKYILRAGHKRKPNESFEAAQLRDLKKAAWYLRRKIQRLENHSGNAKAKEE